MRRVAAPSLPRAPATLRGLALALALAAGACTRSSPPVAPRAGEPPPARVLEPAGAGAGERRPLVIFLHGLGSSPEEVLEEPSIAGFARAHGAYVVVPEGSTDSRGRHFWNAGDACCNDDRLPVDDVSRLTALVDAWRARPGVDPRRVYLVGFSNGGFMAHRLACRIGDRLAAVASVGGAGVDPRDPCLAPPSPLGVLEVHGDQDRIVPYAGGRVFNDGWRTSHPSAQSTIYGWSARLGCAAGEPPTSSLDLDAELAGPETLVARYAGCRLGDAELWTVRGGGHAVGSPKVIDEIWRFLARHQKPAPGG